MDAQRELNQLTASVRVRPPRPLPRGGGRAALRADQGDPAGVARQGFEALMAGRAKVAGGSLENNAQTVLGKFVPDSVQGEMHRKTAQPATAAERGER